MKKSLIALAVAGLFVAPAAMADSGNVKISGEMHMSFDSLNGKNAAGTGLDRNWNVSSNASFIQFDGNEDLGNGLSAVWLLKSYVSMGGSGNTDASSSNGDAFGNGPAYAGLTGKTWGAVLLGKMESPMKILGRKVDLFNNQIGDTRNFSMGFDTRPTNVLAYATPNMNGFNATVAYVTNLPAAVTLTNNPVAAANDKSVDAWAANGLYANGPLFAGLAYERHNLSNGGVAGVQDENSWRLAGSYAFGDFKLLAKYEKANDIGGVSNADRKVWGLGGAYKMGNNTIKAQYTKAGDLASTSDTGANLFSLGFDHALSKRTSVYAAYARTNNDTKAAFSAFGGGHGDNPGGVANQDPSGISLGMIHDF
ncbi:MAG: porin [Sulfuricellaceae bacterium]|nr:porin [Sulfuricellaceae bacterium]